MSDKEDDNKAEGKSVSAITRKTGAENKIKEIAIAIKKNTVLTPLSNPIFLSLQLSVWEERKRKKRKNPS